MDYLDLQSLSAIKKEFAARYVGDELIIVPLKNNVADMDGMFTLNGTGAFIWEQVIPGRSIGEIEKAVVEEFEVDEETAKNDVGEFLENIYTQFLRANTK